MSDVLKPVRRIVTIDDDEGKSVAIADGLPPEIKFDPARPGFSSARIWVTDASPPRIGPFRDALQAHPHRLEPPPRRIDLPYCDISARRNVSGQSRLRRSGGILSRHGFTRGIDRLAHRSSSVYAKDSDTRFLSCPRRRDHAGAGHWRSSPQGWRYSRSARHQSLVEQSIEQAVPDCNLVA